jgi:arsenate reductase
MKIKVLFICVHNSARSQMAQEYLKLLGGEKFEVESAGYEPTAVNPYVIKAMLEEGVDLSSKKTQSVYDLIRENRFFGIIITVCNRAREEECPVFPGVTKKLHWELENPEDFTGTDEEIMEKVRLLRDKIKTMVQSFIAEYNQ